MRKVTILSLIICLLFVGLFSFTPVSAATDREKQIVIAIPTDPDSFSPNLSVAAATTEIAFNIYEGLVKSTPDGALTGALASHWVVDETQQVYTFYLREAYFHNGERVTSADVVNALNRARDPQISQGKASEYQVIEDIQAENDRVIITLSRPYGPFLYNLADLAAAIYPQHAENLDIRPIGTGPYQFVEWRPNQHVKLKRFDQHWSNQEPYFAEVSFQIIPDEASAVLSLKTGHVDLISRLEPDLLFQLEGDSRLKVSKGPMNTVQILALNNQRPPFDDPRVRQALAMAIDKEEIILGAAWGNGDLLASGISPAMSNFYHNSLEEIYPYDPVRARQLLKEAGYENLTFELDLPAPYGLHINAGEIIADQLSKIGVNAKIKIVEWGTWLERIYSQRDYDATIVGLSGKLDPHMILVRYQSDNSRNFFNFSNSRYDEIIAQALSESQEQRQMLYNEAQEILAREVAGIFIMDPHQLAAMQADLAGWHNYPIYVIDVASLYRK